VTCVFTNCPGHLSLREFDLGLAKEEIWKVDRSIRSLLGGYQGYESKGHAGKFMLMFQDTDSAVAFSMQLQRKLLDEQWDQKTLQQPALTEQKDEAGNVYNRGLSVSVGMCTGVPVMFYFSPVNGQMDYFGPVVNRAARIAGKAVPGQICLSMSTLDALSDEMRDTHCAHSLGSFTLKGIDETHEVFQVLPFDLTARFQWCERMRSGTWTTLDETLSQIPGVMTSEHQYSDRMPWSPTTDLSVCSDGSQGS
jgi:class 3 adenylate cyclase